MLISVIISTYNHPKWLEKVLWGYECQSYENFEIIISDDGSGEETQSLIKRFQDNSPLTIKHFWHEDDGFRKTEALNKSILMASGEYLIFTDGDCIPRNDFVETHVLHAKKGQFLSGGYCKLDMPLSELISKQDIEDEQAFKYSWIKQNGLKGSSQEIKIMIPKELSTLADHLTPTKPTWNGMNSSAYKKDILKVNGFNQDMRYGGLDRELGERLCNAGLKSKQIRHRAICLHLDHPRSYENESDWQNNLAIRKEVEEKKVVCCANGIQKYDYFLTSPQDISNTVGTKSLGTYLINLDRSPERLAHSKKQLEIYHIPFERFSAIDGQNINLDDYSEVTKSCPYYYLPLTANEIACYLSHIATLKKFLESDHTHALVLEDDFEWIEDPKPFLDELTCYHDYDIVKLYNMKKRKIGRTIKNFSQTSTGGSPFQLKQYPSVSICNLGQVYTRTGAQKMIDALSSIKRPIDVELKHYWEYGLNIYSISPNLIQQGAESEKSTIGKRKRKKSTRIKARKQYYHLIHAVKKWWYYLS